MLRAVGLSRQSRRLFACVHGHGASAASMDDGGSNTQMRRCAAVVGCPSSPNLGYGTDCCGRGVSSSSSSSSIARSGAVVGGRGTDLLGSWRGVVAGVGGASVGGRRGLAGWGGGRGGGGEGNSGASGTGGSGNDGTPGDIWTPPPDAWKPDEVPPAEPQDFSAMPGFDGGGGFPDASGAAEAAAAAPDVAAAVTATGLSAADLGMYPHHLFMQLIDFVQASAGIPYWEAIVAVSLAARIAVLPATTTFLGMAKRLNMVKPDMAVHQAKMQDLKQRMEANPEIKEAAMKEMMLISQDMGALLKANKIHFPKMFLSMFAQFPVFISLFFATREMGQYFPGYMTGGMDWMLDLSAPDPTWTLPALTAGSMILLMEMGSDMPVAQGADKPAVNPKTMFRVMSVVFVPVAFTMPSGVLVYWTTTNIFGMLQRAAFEMRPVQQALGWPLPEDMPPAAKPDPPEEEPREADFASKEDLERWGGRGSKASGEASREAADAAERAREAVAKASKARHEELKREHEEQKKGDSRQ